MKIYKVNTFNIIKGKLDSAIEGMFSKLELAYETFDLFNNKNCVAKEIVEINEDNEAIQIEYMNYGSIPINNTETKLFLIIEKLPDRKITNIVEAYNKEDAITMVVGDNIGYVDVCMEIIKTGKPDLIF